MCNVDACFCVRWLNDLEVTNKLNWGKVSELETIIIIDSYAKWRNENICEQQNPRNWRSFNAKTRNEKLKVRPRERSWYETKPLRHHKFVCFIDYTICHMSYWILSFIHLNWDLKLSFKLKKNLHHILHVHSLHQWTLSKRRLTHIFYSDCLLLNSVCHTTNELIKANRRKITRLMFRLVQSIMELAIYCIVVLLLECLWALWWCETCKHH